MLYKTCKFLHQLNTPRRSNEEAAIFQTCENVSRPADALLSARDRSGGSNSTHPQINKQKSEVSDKERAIIRVIVKFGGSEKAVENEKSV